MPRYMPIFMPRFKAHFKAHFKARFMTRLSTAPTQPAAGASAAQAKRVVTSAMARAMALVAMASAACFAAPSFAQTKAAFAKSAPEFFKASEALTTSINTMTKRLDNASPFDKDQLKLILAQLGRLDATADGVLALGYVAAEMRDNSDLAAAKKQLAVRCSALKKAADGIGPYVGGLAANFAAKDLMSEATKAKDLIAQIGQSSLCAGVGK